MRAAKKIDNGEMLILIQIYISNMRLHVELARSTQHVIITIIINGSYTRM